MPNPGPQTPPAPPSRLRQFWKGVRRGFRWFRILVLLKLLTLAGFLLYWHQTGLPDFVKSALLEALRHRGLDLQFRSLHFRWDRGLVAQDVEFGRDQLVAGPRLRAGEVQIVVDAAAALRGKLQINLLRLRDGRVIWRFADGQPPTPPLVVSRLQTELWIHDTTWELRQFTGEFQGAEFRIQGVISNALAFARQWADAQSPTNAGPSAHARAHGVLRDFAHALTNWQFFGKHQAELSFQLDALHWGAARLELRTQADGAHTPWGNGEHLMLNIRRMPDPQQPLRAAVAFEMSAALFSNRWGKVEHGRWMAHTHTTPHAWWNTNLQITLQARHLEVPPCRAEQVDLDGQWTTTRTNFTWRSQSLQSPWTTTGPLELRVESPNQANPSNRCWQVQAKCASLELPELGRARQSQLHAEVELANVWPPTPSFVQGHWQNQDWQAARAATGLVAAVEWKATLAENALATLTNSHLPLAQRAAPIALQWRLALSTSRLDTVLLESASVNGAWAAPLLTLTNLHARLAAGSMKLSATLEVERRALNGSFITDADWHALTPYLPPAWQKEIAAVQWEHPPQVEGTLATTLPEWGVWPTNWLATLAPLTRGQITLQLGPTRWREVSLTEGAAQVEWDGRQGRVSRLEARTGTNQLRASATLREDGWLEARLDWKGLPEPLHPFLPSSALAALSLWEWRQPPEIQIQGQGHWRQPESWQAEGEVRAAQFSFRGVAIEELATRFHYASNVLTLLEPKIRHPEGEATAQRVEVDFNSQMVFLNKARGTVDPMVVAQTIGPHVVKTLAPFKFGRPIQAEVSGDIPMHGELGARVDFHLAGSPFAWWRFHASNVTATVRWVDEAVTITNLWADFYGGRLQGDLHLDFSSHRDTDMQLQFSLNQIQLAGLMADISNRTNRLEGLLSGHLDARARAGDWKNWNGFGNVELTDGLIWDIPIFGLFSPLLNAISPGLGNSRAREARGSFVIHNSIIKSDDLLIQATGYNLKYRGTVDFDYQVDARVEAELLRETKMLGPALSLFFKPFTKLFEYRVTGTLAEPKTKPVYIPGFLMKILTPFRSLRELLRTEPENKPAAPSPSSP